LLPDSFFRYAQIHYSLILKLEASKPMASRAPSLALGKIKTSGPIPISGFDASETPSYEQLIAADGHMNLFYN
jgi:hypothetical protein